MNRGLPFPEIPDNHLVLPYGNDTKGWQHITQENTTTEVGTPIWDFQSPNLWKQNNGGL